MSRRHQPVRCVEKQNLEQARDFLVQGNCDWNCGMPVFRACRAFVTLEPPSASLTHLIERVKRGPP
jgi:mannose-1-phosphate guanylyltransferase